MLARAAELEAADRPFAIATVVAVRRPTSARPGARGIVHPDRSIEGWVGGSCAQPIVVREALAALADGQPRLLRLSKDGRSERESVDGVIDHVMTCHSGGTLEIFVEPHLPRPALWVAGTTPIASALVTLGAASGYRVTLADPDATTESFPGADRVLATSDLASLDVGAAPFAVVATQGQWDEEALEGLLGRQTEPAYVGLVTSPKRAASIREYLADQRLAAGRVASLRAPAGLDLGAATAEEVALSILAELVAIRRQTPAPLVAVGPGGGFVDRSSSPAEPAVRAATAEPAVRAATPEPAAADGPAEAAEGGPSRRPRSLPDEIVLRDPVCGMTVDREDVRYITRFEGLTYAFCRLPCRTAFLKDPGAYALPATPVPG